MTTNTHTPSREEMIDVIYEKIARKDLSFGCKVINKTRYRDEEDVVVERVVGGAQCRYIGYTNEKHIKKIIGHPVMIGDVMDYFHKNHFHFAISNDGKIIGNKNRAGSYFNFFWDDFLKPINEQSDDCIKFIYNLISA